MKKISFLLFCATTGFIACTNDTNHETRNNVVLAENVESIIPLVPDTTWDEQEWKALYKYDQEKLFSTFVKGVLSNKLKAYSDVSDPQTELTTQEFTNIIVAWDSSAVAEVPNNPGNMIMAPVKYELTGEDIVQIRFNEKIEMDTVSYMLHKTASSVSFISYMYSETGEMLGLKHLFDVKLEKPAGKK